MNAIASCLTLHIMLAHGGEKVAELTSIVSRCLMN